MSKFFKITSVILFMATTSAPVAFSAPVSNQAGEKIQAQEQSAKKRSRPSIKKARVSHVEFSELEIHRICHKNAKNMMYHPRCAHIKRGVEGKRGSTPKSMGSQPPTRDGR